MRRTQNNILFFNLSFKQRTYVNFSLLPLVIKRGMKRAMAQYPKDKKEIIYNVASEGIYWANTYFGKGPITSEHDLLKRHATYISSPTAQIKLKSANTSIMNRGSYNKSIMFDTLNNEVSLSKKLEIEKPLEHTNVNFMIELMLASRLAEYSTYILRLINLSENTKNLPRAARTPDFLCVLRNKKLFLDTKAGANALRDVFGGSIGEVSYTKDLTPSTALIKTDLNKIQASRISQFRNNKFLKDKLLQIQNSNLDILRKNGIIQDTMYDYLNDHPESIMRPSVYAPIIITDSLILTPQEAEELNKIFNFILNNVDREDMYLNPKNLSYFLSHVVKVLSVDNPQIIDNVKNSLPVLTGTGAEMFVHEATSIYN